MSCMAQDKASHIPDHYRLLYQADFDQGSPTKWDFTMTDPAAWRIVRKDTSAWLELFGNSQYKPKVRSPFNIALISGMQFGSFVLEVDLLQTGREYGHRDLCLFFGMKDPSNFYYVHMASVPDPHAHNIFLVNDEPRVAIAGEIEKGIDWGDAGKDWHTIRLERDIEKGTIRVYFDNMEAPVLEANDTHFDYGHIGFGSFDDSGRYDNIRIWGPDTAPVQQGFFK